MNLKKKISFILILSLMISYCSFLIPNSMASSNIGQSNNLYSGRNTKTAQEAINEMKAGINIGNTLDSCNYQKQYLGEAKGVSYYETLWGNPQITEELIKNLKNDGFTSIRLPVTYYDHIHSDGTIDELWFQRVETVVKCILDNDMYCILDIHHDSGLCNQGSWITTDADKYEENAKKIENMWIQIGNRFKDYDYKLVFEGFNEIVDTNKNYDWNSGYNNTITVNKLNQVFVDTVRKTGGKNADRFLAVSTFGAITDDQKLSTFVMPRDTAEDKIILALHDYCNNEQTITSMYDRIKKYCVDKNIPVILDEYGTTSYFASEDQRAEVAKLYVEKAKELGIACFWWDDGGDYKIYDRNNKTWIYGKIKNAITEPFKQDEKPEEDKPSTKYVKGDVDGDKRITINDLAIIKMHCLGLKQLTGNSFLAADLDENGNVDINDLAKEKLHILGL